MHLFVHPLHMYGLSYAVDFGHYHDIWFSIWILQLVIITNPPHSVFTYGPPYGARYFRLPDTESSDCVSVQASDPYNTTGHKLFRFLFTLAPTSRYCSRNTLRRKLGWLSVDGYSTALAINISYKAPVYYYVDAMADSGRHNSEQIDWNKIREPPEHGKSKNSAEIDVENILSFRIRKIFYIPIFGRCIVQFWPDSLAHAENRFDRRIWWFYRHRSLLFRCCWHKWTVRICHYCRSPLLCHAHYQWRMLEWMHASCWRRYSITLSYTTWYIKYTGQPSDHPHTALRDTYILSGPFVSVHTIASLPEVDKELV